MQHITLPGTDLAMSRLVFGTASLFNAGGAAKRRALLEAAVDAGFTHFDTAPFYGFGANERALAEVFSAHERLTVTTKVGLYSPGGEDQHDWAVLARKAAGRAWPALSRPERDFSLQRAERALAGSLRRLGRDRIDLYLMHEAEAGLFPMEEWASWMQGRVRAGAIRHWGVAAPAGKVAGLLSAGFAPPVIQCSDSLVGREADAVRAIGRTPQLAYGYIAAALRQAAPPPVEEVIAGAFARNPLGAVLVGTTRPERVRELAELARRAEQGDSDAG